MSDPANIAPVPEPLLTVVLPVRNAAAYLQRALDSLQTQTFGDFRVLVIDDGSTDGSGEILQSLRDPRFSVVRREARGLVHTLNEGLERAATPYVARMDADDCSLPERFARQVQALEADPALALVGSQARVIDAAGAPMGQLPALTEHAAIRRALAVTNCFVHGSTVFRREIALRAGAYRASAALVEDYDLWQRIAELGRVANHAEVLYEWRATPAGASRSRRAEQRAAAERVADGIWQAWFGEAGPAPREAWPEIWRPGSEPLFASNLHLLFARGYLRRGRRALAFSHVRAALAFRPHSMAGWAYAGAFSLPPRWFTALEGHARTLMERQRGW